MCKKSLFRGPFNNQQGKWNQTVLKSEWHPFYHIYWSLWKQLSSKKSLLAIGKKPTTIFWHSDCRSQVFSSCQRQFNAVNSDAIVSKRKNFFSCFSPFLKFRRNFEHCQNKMVLIADVFSKLPTRKAVVR